MKSRIRLFLTLGALAALLVAPRIALAQDAPEGPPPPGPPPMQAGPEPMPPGPNLVAPGPSYSVPGEDRITGTVATFDGHYALQVRDDRGYLDNVQLHQGTIINPTGLTLYPGMRVTIYGLNKGGYLDANQIDTPYQTYGPLPYYYPVYPYPYAYGPRLSIGIGFAPWGWGWHGRYWH